MATPEEEARQNIDQRLGECGWAVQDYRQMNISAGPRVAVREFPPTAGVVTNALDLDARSRDVFSFRCPEELRRLVGLEKTQKDPAPEDRGVGQASEQQAAMRNPGMIEALRHS